MMPASSSPLRAAPSVLIAVWVAAACSSSDEGAAATPPPDAGDAPPPLVCDTSKAESFLDSVNDKVSCALDCDPDCKEPGTPFVCPALADWRAFPHDCAGGCGTWDGANPTPQKGRCQASEPAADAVTKTAAKGNPVVLPDGRRVVAAGKEWVFEDADLKGTFPASALWIPKTRFVVVSDDGYEDHALRVLDTDKLAAGTDPTVSKVKFARPKSLNYGLALGADGTLYAASGAPDSVVRAFSVDAQTGALAAQPTKDVAVQNAAAGDVYPSGIAVSPDGKTLVVAQVKVRNALVYSIETPTAPKKVLDVDLGPQGDDQFAVAFDPASSQVAYVSAWIGARIAEIDIGKKTVRAIPTGKQPEEMAFLDAKHLAVANSLEDDIAIVDRVDGKVVASVPVDAASKDHGPSPSALAYDAASSRLYAVLAGSNGVAVFDVAAGTPPALKPAGVVPTGWWPTDVVVAGASEPSPGALVVLTGKGHGTGPMPAPQLFNQGSIGLSMRGSAAWIPKPDAAALAAQSDAWKKASRVADLAGRPEVTCPQGAAYDFPVPRTNTEGPSKLIDRVILVVRENKTFDAIMGDLEGVDGDAKSVMAPGKMEDVWGNIRSVARQFAHADNFYEDAEQSLQGHFWTVFGRSSDYSERTWLTTWGRGTRSLFTAAGVPDATRPKEGGVFAWLEANKVPWENMGELVGDVGHDSVYGVVSTSGTIPDTRSACYMAGRARAVCNLRAFTYAWFVNDHAFGGEAGKPNPGLMISVNDEATGMLLDAVSHSPMWKGALVVVIEDDPQDGADHVDAHRSIAVFASPWVKRKYVSHTHFDVASLHKLLAHLYGIPYPNTAVRDAALPLDLFTSTPDYTPFTYAPRTWKDQSCNAKGTPMAVEAERLHWDFSEPDDQPGLSRQNWLILHDGLR